MNPQQPAPPQNSANNNFVPSQPQSSVNPPVNPYGTPPGQPVFAPPPAKKSRKKLFAVLAIVFVLLAGASAYVFFFYLPNRPENVWKTGLDRSGEVLNELSARATTAEQLEKLEQSEVTGSVSLESEAGDGAGFNADLNVKFDALKVIAEGNVEASLPGQEDFNVMLDLLSETTEGNRFPDVYFRVSGLTGLGQTPFRSFINEFDSKWIAVSSEYLEEVSGGDPGDTAQNEDPVTAQEISEAAKVLTEVTGEYIFTSDPEKSVLVLERFVGKEEVEGMDSYHYRASTNVDNSIKYCEEITGRLLRMEAVKKLYGDLSDTEIEEQQADCEEDIRDSYEENERFDIWIDAKYKLINRLRLYYDDDETEYVDIGQSYTGGDEVPFYMDFSNSYEGLTEGRFTVTANLKTLNTKGELRLSGKTGEDSWQANASLEYKPYDETLEIDPPADAIDIEDAIESLTGPPTPVPVPGDDLVLGANNSENANTRGLLEILDSFLPER